MENFQASGEDIERALMDLGPLLGVSIKEEVPEEAPDAALSANTTNGASGSEGPAGGEAGASGAGAGAGQGSGKEGEGADSLGGGAAARASSARCVLCHSSLAQADGTPKLMECLHSACEPCIKAKIDEKMAGSRDFLGAERMTITCPACRLQCQPANMIDQRFVLEKLALDQGGNSGGVAGEQACNSCEDTEPATSYCVDCAEFICDNCVNAHQRLKITKDHTIKSKQQASAELLAAQTLAVDMFCREHPQERLSLFCETCDRLTCRDCQLQHHRDHKYQFSTEMAAQARAGISSLLSEVSYKRVLLGSAMQVINERQQLIADKKRALVHDITQTVVRLTNAINTRGKQLVLRLNEVCDAKQKTLSEKKEALDQLASMTDHVVGFVSSALLGSDTAVLYSKRAVSSHLQRIKSRRADIPNPEIPVRISLAIDKLPDLVRVLSTIGAIVVDGKVDGGAGGQGAGGQGALGPYHPPAQPPTPTAPAPANPPHSAHSAVLALQHVAMHQAGAGYLSMGAGLRAAIGAGGGAVAGGGAGRAIAHTPLRHPHVTSTTHPHHLHGMSELNLRGLLAPVGGRAGPSPRAQHHHQQHHQQHQQQQQQQAQAQAVAMHHAYQQMMGAYASGAYPTAGGPSGRRSGGPRTPSPAPPHAPPPHYALTTAKWHIPQQGLPNGGLEPSVVGGADFKITLGPRRLPPAPCAPPAVTSTNPKTPSPSLNGGLSSELDKVCAESVQDLMATIAKLDSNGVQVVAEGGASPAPMVHSSTDADHAPHAHAHAHAQAQAQLGPAAQTGKPLGVSGGDPNEDWCAVCMDGGELMCCDKCPKVFHQYCHIPTIEKLPDETETWQCLLCVNFAELPPDEGAGGVGGAGAGLTPRQQKLVERLTLELYCQYETSLPFREPVPADNAHYHAQIPRPMCLDAIRMKLQPGSATRYSHVAHFVADCRLLFSNAYAYNAPDSQIYKDAKRLEEFFEAQLLKLLPEHATCNEDQEPPTKRQRPH